MPESTPPRPNRRRSQRVFVQMKIVVRGQNVENQHFREETQTLAVSAHGALLLLGTPVRNGQTLLLTNAGTHEDQECRVVFLGPAQGGKTQVGVEFTQTAPNFWHIAFPPDDWKNVPA